MCAPQVPIWEGIGARSARVRRGSTLIELLVVITLIGLLIGMLLPSVSRSMKAAADTLCKHHLRELGHSLVLYQMDNDGWLPTADRSSGGVGLGDDEPAEPWFAKLFPTYLNEMSILTCPEDPYRFRLAELDDRWDQDPNVGEYASYGLNGFILTSGGGELAQEDRIRPARPLDTMLGADIGPDRSDERLTVRGQNLNGPSRNESLLTWDDGFDPFARRESPVPWITQRHNGGMNVLTLEGGVRRAHTDRLFNEPIRRYYHDCAAGGCTFCNRLEVPHYSFARDRIFWWTGAAPLER